MAYCDSWTTGDILALSHVRGINSVVVRQLVERYSSLEECLEHASLPSFRRLIQRDLFSPPLKERLSRAAEHQLALCEKSGTRVVSIWDSEYPSLLSAIAYPPALLWIRGTFRTDQRSIAIVGTRHCTQYGRQVAEQIARECADAGIHVVSGLAAGIDTVAHEASMRCTAGTSAVLPSGTDVAGPESSRRLAEHIVDCGGSLISEYRCGTRAIPPFFPQRDRIISGIAEAVIVVESAERGGSLITAEFAREQGRLLYAVPGSILSERSLGTNTLIMRALARPLLSGSQLLTELGMHSQDRVQRVLPEFRSDLEQGIYVSLENGAQHLDQLVADLHCPMSELLVTLLALECRGIVKQGPGKMIARCP